jgi:signal transduction histidine kinase
MPEDAFSPPLLPLIAGSLVSLLFAALLARYFSRPIRALRRAFDATANGKLDTRIGLTMAHRHDELSDLGADFDRMADRLQRVVKGKQRLLHDVSHELRSPLARLKAIIDLMQQQPERQEEFVARMGRESDRIDRLVGELLTLARLDSGLPGSQVVAVDLNEIIETIVDDASVEAEAKQCRVEIRLPERSRMTGYPELLHRAIENIVRNAIRHTPEGSTVTVVGETDNDANWLSLHVMDEGAGVSDADLKQIFEPFYRSGTAEPFQGYGIGMAITQRVVEAHGGKTTVKNREGSGLRVTLNFPLTSEEGC